MTQFEFECAVVRSRLILNGCGRDNGEHARDTPRGESMPASRAKEERMWKLAHEMAQSGEFSSWHIIEALLRAGGYPRARYLLDNERVRERLDRMCAQARK